MPLAPTRRRFLGAAAGFAAAAALGDGFLVEPTAIEVTRHDLVIPGLAPRLAGLRVACVTDVHLNGGVQAPARATLARLAQERPEVVVLIGDIFNRRRDLTHLATWARDARGTLATFATLGNWEHDAGVDRGTAEQSYGQLGVELLYNSSARVRVGTDVLTVVGIDDPVAGEPDVAAAVREVDAAHPAIWVLHAPGFVDGIPRGRFPNPQQSSRAIPTAARSGCRSTRRTHPRVAAGSSRDGTAIRSRRSTSRAASGPCGSRPAFAAAPSCRSSPFAQREPARRRRVSMLPPDTGAALLEADRGRGERSPSRRSLDPHLGGRLIRQLATRWRLTPTARWTSRAALPRIVLA